MDYLIIIILSVISTIFISVFLIATFDEIRKLQLIVKWKNVIKKFSPIVFLIVVYLVVLLHILFQEKQLIPRGKIMDYLYIIGIAILIIIIILYLTYSRRLYNSLVRRTAYFALYETLEVGFFPNSPELPRVIRNSCAEQGVKEYFAHFIPPNTRFSQSKGAKFYEDVYRALHIIIEPTRIPEMFNYISVDELCIDALQQAKNITDTFSYEIDFIKESKGYFW